jgi:hypothetical protein
MEESEGFEITVGQLVFTVVSYLIFAFSMTFLAYHAVAEITCCSKETIDLEYVEMQFDEEMQRIKEEETKAALKKLVQEMVKEECLINVKVV